MVDVLGQTIAPLMRTNADVASFYGRPREKMLECGDIELDALECLEAYGSRRGRVLCDKYIQDFRECMKQYIQKRRVDLMRRERIKQIFRGERKYSDGLDPIQPPRDAFMSGPFYN